MVNDPTGSATFARITQLGEANVLLLVRTVWTCGCARGLRERWALDGRMNEDRWRRTGFVLQAFSQSGPRAENRAESPRSEF